MNKLNSILAATAALLALAGCGGTQETYDPLEGYEQIEPSNVQETPAPVPVDYPADRVERGRYMVGLLGCGNCHTDGALLGKPDVTRLLAGSRVGIARSDPTAERHPGVVFPSNLTPDPATGIGNWTLEQVETMLQSGTNRHGQRSLSVMPWPIYTHLLPEDATAIAMYLKSLPPVQHQVPQAVRPGQPTDAPFIHFGVYRSREN